MKKLLLVSLASVLLLGGPAVAADMPAKAPPVPAPPPTWTGCYVEGGAGFGLWNQTHDTVTPALTTQTTTDGGNGWLGRLGAGCDYQVKPRWVVGLLGEYDFMNLKGTNSPSLLFPVAPPNSPIAANEKESSAWYFGARVGYLLTPSILTYFDGGYTQTRFDAQSEFQTASGTAIGFGFPAQTYHGWFVGGGTETSLSGLLADYIPGLPNGLFLRSEYRYSTYQSVGLPEQFLATGVNDGNVENTKPHVQTITTSLIWRFNWTGH